MSFNKVFTIFLFLFKLCFYLFLFFFFSDSVFDLQRTQTVAGLVKDFIFPLDDYNDFEIIRATFYNHEDFSNFLKNDLNYNTKNSRIYDSIADYSDDALGDESYFLRDFKNLKTYYICYIFNDFCLENGYLPYTVDILHFKNNSLKMIKNSFFENSFQKEVFNNFCLNKGENQPFKFPRFERISIFDFDTLVDRPTLRIKKLRDLIVLTQKNVEIKK